MVKLSYAEDALSPIMSEMTLEFHYGKHYAAYVNKLNELIQGTDYENMPLDEIIKTSDGAIFNNAGQTSNHTLFFTQFSHQGNELQNGEFIKHIARTFGSLDDMKRAMSDEAKKLFGSGWTFLALDKGELKIVSGSNAFSPIREGMVPLLAIDVWEHAYYLDYQNRRPDFVDAFWDIIDWNAVEKRYDDAKK